jgi:hypothetical protein
MVAARAARLVLPVAQTARLAIFVARAVWLVMLVARTARLAERRVGAR